MLRGKSRLQVKEPEPHVLPALGKQDTATIHAFAALPASHRKVVRAVILALGGTEEKHRARQCN